MASSKDEKSTDLLSKDAQIDSLCNCQCIFSLYGNDYVKQREYTCPKCLSDGAICEYCYFNCHKNCSKTKKKSKVVNYLVCDCALVLKHHALPSSQEESNEEKSKDVLVTKEQKDNVIMDYILHPEIIKREINPLASLSEQGYFSQNESARRIIYFKNENNSPYYVTYSNISYRKILKTQIDLSQLLTTLQWGLFYDNNILTVYEFFRYICTLIHFDYIGYVFQNVKALTVNDFMNCSFSELLAYRARIHANNSFSLLVSEFISSGILKNTIRLVSRALDKFTFSISNDYLCFIRECAQYMLLDIDDIEVIVNSYFSIKLEKQGDVQDQYLLVDTMFILGKTYEMLLFEEYVNNGTSEYNHIFYDNEIGEKILIMMTVSTAFTVSKEFPWNQYYRNYYNLEKINHLFFYPFNYKQIDFDRANYDSILRMIEDKSNVDKKNEIIAISNAICELRNEFTDQEETLNKINQFSSLLDNLCKYITSRITTTNTIEYQSKKHYKLVHKVNKFFKLSPSTFIQNIDAIINDLIYVNIDTSISKMILYLLYLNQEGCELFEKKTPNYLEKALNVLSLFLLSEKGIEYFRVGEAIHNLITAKKLSFKSFFFPCFVSLSSFLSLLPKKIIEEPVTDAIDRDDYDKDKRTRIQFLKDLKKIYAPESEGSTLLSELMEDFYNFINEDFTKEKFYDIVLKKEKTKISTEEKNNIKLLIAYIDVLSITVNPMREKYYDFYEKCFDFFDHPEIESVLKSSFLSLRKKKAILTFMTMFWLAPVYTDYDVQVYPLSNPMFAAYNRHFIAKTEKDKSEGEFEDEDSLEADKLDKESVAMIEKKLKRYKRIILLFKLLRYCINEIPNSYNKNSKEYFDMRSFYKRILKCIKIGTNYVYNRQKKISQLILFPFAKLVVGLIEKEFVLLKLFDIDSSEDKTISIEQVDEVNLFSLVNSMNKELFKFVPVIEAKKYQSIYSLYMKNNKDDLFYKSYTPFSFIENKQLQNAILQIDEKNLGENENFSSYKSKTIEQINELKGYVIFNAFNNNTQVARKSFIHYFFTVLFNNYIMNLFPLLPDVLNFYYKICCYDLNFIDAKITERKLFAPFFSKIKQLLPFLLRKCYYESSLYNGTDIEYKNSFIAVTLVKFIELFGEGYNYNFHREILTNSAELKPLPFEQTPDELDGKESEEEEEEEQKEEKEEKCAQFIEKESIMISNISQRYNSKIEDSENLCIPSKHQKTLFDIVVQNLSLNIYKVIKGYRNNGESPFRNNLIMLINAEIDFIIEFLYTFNYEHEEIIERSLIWLFHIHDYYKSQLVVFIRKIPEKNNELSFIKGRLIDLLISYLNSANNQKFTNSLFSLTFFNEMVSHFSLLLESCSNSSLQLSDKIAQLNTLQSEDEYTNALIELYTWEEQFRRDWHMAIIIKYIKLISLLETKFNQLTICQTLENEKNQNMKEYIKKKGLYNFLHKILINIEFNYVLSEKEKANYISKEECLREKEKRRQERNNNQPESAVDFMRQCMQISNASKEDTTPEEAAQKKYGQTFYILPYFTYYLTNQSKIRFEENVDRTSKSTKAKGLITYIESFVFEMIVNEHMFKKNTSLSQRISKLNYFTFELVNFGFICLHNMILLIRYYKSWTLDQAAYETLDTDEFNSLLYNKNWILAVLQLLFLGAVLGVWYKFNYIQCYFNNLQVKYESKEPLFKRLRKFRELYLSEQPDFYGVLNKHFEHVDNTSKLKVAILDSFFLNSEICILLYTFILLLCYLIFHSPLFLVIPVLFLAHIFDTLSAIFKGVYSRFGHLFAVYIFTYLTIYIFMWTGFLFFNELFSVDTINSHNDPVATEPFCTSSIQCLLFFINYGIRSGGGIGDLLGTPSFKDNYWFFMKIFVYEILFHLMIVMVFANVFLGLIADAFGELREAAELKSNDKENICFICQVNSDDCAIKGVDFEEHVTKKHNLWDYINFLCYLYLKDENEYNLMEYKIMSSISEFNLSWIPYAGNEDDD